MSAIQLNRYIDHTLLKPTATPEDINRLCDEAIKHDFYAICVNGGYVKQAKKKLQGTTVKLAAVIGFPLGAMSKRTKLFEAKQCIAEGANEIDMVINLGLLKAGEHDAVEDEIKAIKKGVEDNVLKVILETCYLTEEDIEIASKLAIAAGADFIKTSTGFGSRGASPEDVKIMKRIGENQIKIKASGGIKDKETALMYIKLGADRIGTSSGIKIISN